MLLLLRGVVSGATAATLGLSLGLSGVAGTTATLSTQVGLTQPTTVELNVFASPDIKIGLTGIPVGFLSRSATLDSQLGLAAVGGFGQIPTLTLTLGLSGTVGSFLQGLANPAITHGLSASGTISGASNLRTFLALSGSPTVSGGTVTPSASTGLQLSLAGTAVLSTQSILDITHDLTGAGITKVPNLATDMRLSFETDEIRLFFRKG